MEIQVDWDSCDSNGVCEGIAPDLFRLDDEDYLQIHEGEIPADRLDAARQAAASCPKAAISLRE